MKPLSAEEILKQHAQRSTDKRVALLELLMDSPEAYSLSDIEGKLSIAMDRVTIYRTLHTYEALGLVMKIVDRKGVCLYTYNHSSHKEGNCHPHLRCKKCNEVVCLPGLPSEYLSQLASFQIDEIYLLMEGLCPKCLAKDADS